LIFASLRPSELLALRRQDISFDRDIIIVARNLTRFGEDFQRLPTVREKWICSRPCEGLSPNSKPVSGSRARSSSATGVAVRSAAKKSAARGFRLLRIARLRERPLYQCRHSYVTLLLSEGLNPLYVAHQMGHSTVAMIVRHDVRWTRKPDRSDADRVERSLAAAGLIPPKNARNLPESGGFGIF